jgi:hypothetical protein
MVSPIRMLSWDRRLKTSTRRLLGDLASSGEYMSSSPRV